MSNSKLMYVPCLLVLFLEVGARVADNHQGEWLATGEESGTKFEGVELHEGEWFDYDEKASDEVSITNLVWEIRRA